jgi:hypothetical protein
MRAEDVLAHLRKRPFVSVRLQMIDGRVYDNQDPATVLVSRSHAMVGIQPDSMNGVVDRIERCGLMHIVRIEEMPVAPHG